jgi:hypothetical protein
MAKCSNCDYPYVPRYKSCPECSYCNSSDNESSNDVLPPWWVILLLLICWCIYSIYDYCVFNENDFIKKKYKLNNAEIKVWESDNNKYYYSRDYPYDTEMNRCDDSGEFKVLNDSIILFPDSIFYREKVKPEKYYKNDFKEIGID